MGGHRYGRCHHWDTPNTNSWACVTHHSLSLISIHQNSNSFIQLKTATPIHTHTHTRTHTYTYAHTYTHTHTHAHTLNCMWSVKSAGDSTPKHRHLSATSHFSKSHSLSCNWFINFADISYATHQQRSQYKFEFWLQRNSNDNLCYFWFSRAHLTYIHTQNKLLILLNMAHPLSTHFVHTFKQYK